MIDGPVLALDSSTATGSAAVGDTSGVLAEVVLRVSGGHSAALLPAADQAMRAAGLRPADLAAIVIGGGPGSFTGLRVAAATAKGMVQGLEVPLYAYSSLLAAAVGGFGAGDVCALFDARRRDVYAARYRLTATGVDTVLAPCALALDALLEILRREPPSLFIGEGAGLHEEEIAREMGVPVAPGHLVAPRASSLIWLASRYPRLGYVEDAAAWEPDYVRASGAERIAAARSTSPGAG